MSRTACEYINQPQTNTKIHVSTSVPFGMLDYGEVLSIYKPQLEIGK